MRIRILVALASTACAFAAHARTFHVVADGMTFTPAQLTIYKGDAIVFENAGGIHNVREDNDRFWCSVNCSTNHAPSELPWHATVRFDRLGTLGYYCEQHGDVNGGMRGSITVIDRIFVDGFEIEDVGSAFAPDS